MTTDVLEFPTRKDFRTYLHANHLRKTEAWLSIAKKNSTLTRISYEDAVEEAVCFGWIDGKMHSVDDDTYILRFSPRRPNSRWSQSNKSRAEKLMANGSMTPAGLDRIREAKENGRWSTAYSSKTKPDIPPDLKDALDGDPKGWLHFNNFTNSQQTMYIAWIEDARKPETRMKRIREVAARAAENRKPG